MAQDISLLGANYSAVPSVTLPKQGGGTASFTDVTDTTAAASDVASGKYFYTAAGVKTAGTNSGGGGGGIGTLLGTASLGAINVTSTSATNLNKTVTINDVSGYDLLIVETSVDTKTNGRHLATVSLVHVTQSSGGLPTRGTTGSNVTARPNFKRSSQGVDSSTASTTAYGVYVNSTTLTVDGNKVKAQFKMYGRYNDTNTSTINGNYTTRVYGVKYYELIGG